MDLDFPYRPLSRCGHLDFTQFQLTVTKLRLDEIIVWCHICAMNLAFITYIGNREHDQDGDGVMKVYEYPFVFPFEPVHTSCECEYEANFGDTTIGTHTIFLFDALKFALHKESGMNRALLLCWSP